MRMWHRPVPGVKTAARDGRAMVLCRRDTLGDFVRKWVIAARKMPIC
jgi:hypothetical protein